MVSICITMKYVRKTTRVLLVVIALISTVLSNKSMAEQTGNQLNTNETFSISSIDLYNNMILAEKELEDQINVDENEEKDNRKASLLSMITTSTGRLQCMSCTGVLPSIWFDRHIDEQAYCLPDIDSTQSLCTEAVRCWKAKVRQQDGQIRISRGCIGNGQNNSDNNGLHICLGTNPVVRNETTMKNKENLERYTVWTTSHTYTSVAGNQQSSILPPSYAIECCTGINNCNNGPFPSLPEILPVISSNNKFTVMPWWSLIFVIAIATTVTLVIVITLLRNSEKNQKHGFRKKENGHSDRRKRVRQNFSLSSSSCSESERKFHVTSLATFDLLKGVVVTKNMTDDSDDMYSCSPYLAESGMTGFSVDENVLLRLYEQEEKTDFTSGSGYGLPVLVQRTLAKQVQLRQLVGKGRYGEVWRATYWNGGHETVAVKIFLSKDEPSWKRESEIYSTVLMRHDNILAFIGSDIMTSRNSYTTQLLLITHFHQDGSLYDFLQTNIDSTCNMTEKIRPPLTINQMLNVLYSVISGLCHLHTEIHGTQGKPAIAHRDIKSKNVLVKCARTGVCCVADFGMAVTSKDKTLPIQTTMSAGSNCQNTRVGTKRYMAPEILDDSISVALSSVVPDSTSAYWCFDAYRRSDMYSYALIMWEVLSRTLICPEGSTSVQKSISNEYNPYNYRAPYEDRGVGLDPGFEVMRSIVCSSDPIRSRPGVATEWLDNPITNSIVKSMRECWHFNPNVRLPALRVKKTLAKLIDHLYTTSETKIE